MMFGVQPRMAGSKFFPVNRVAIVPRSRIPPERMDMHVFIERFFPFKDLPIDYVASDDSMSPAEIIDAVCRAHGITRGQLVGCRRNTDLIPPRREAAQRLRGVGLSTPEIGRMLQRDHTTIMSLLGMLNRNRVKRAKQDSEAA